MGNDPDGGSDARVQRGQRVWCSNRGRRGGCGRSFPVFLAEVLPRHTVRAPALWALLERLVQGGSIKAAVEALGPHFALESFYHLWQRLPGCLPAARAALCRERKAPASSQTHPLLQTVEHLREVFGQSDCPLSEFQLHFQRPLLE